MTTAKNMVALGSSALLALGGVGGALTMVATADAQPADTNDQAIAHQVSTETSIVKQVQVRGDFDFTQTEVPGNAEFSARIMSAAKYLCNSQLVAANENQPAADWVVRVRGDVENPCAMSLNEFKEGGYAKTLIMGCSCAANPADGTASANALITGIPINDLLEVAQPTADVNTIVFTSADGYEVALPYSYIQQHTSTLVFDVNESPLVESVGGSNQLWLGSTPASYFVRDVVAVTLEERATPPANPASDEARAELQNLPNIGVLYGGDIR